MKHPYTSLENTALWKILDASIANLEANQDLNLGTAREHVIGYLCMQIITNKPIIDDLKNEFIHYCTPF